MSRRPSASPPRALSPSPSRADMSLTDLTRQGHEPHPPMPQAYVSDGYDQREYYPIPRTTSSMLLPPIQTRQLREQTQRPLQDHPTSTPSQAQHSHQYPPTSLDHILHHPRPSSIFSPVHSSPSNYSNVSARESRFNGRHSTVQPDLSINADYRQEIRRDVTDEHAPRTPLFPPSHDQDTLSSTTEDTSPAASSQRRLAAKPGYSKPMVYLGLPPPEKPSSTFSPDAEYDIIIRQQPVAARACGFGERDRRVIDPPPILEMRIRDRDSTPANLGSKLRYPFSVIHCELWNADLDVEEAAMPDVGERHQQRRLMGTLVASPFVGRDERNIEGCFFPFPDLSCRTTGRYRLKFVLVILDPASMKPGDRLPFRASTISEIFEVYPAKTFPGMIQSTELTKRLKEQGCLISVKKGHQRSRATTSRENTAEDDAG